MPQHYDETFKKKIVRLRIEDGRAPKGKSIPKKAASFFAKEID